MGTKIWHVDAFTDQPFQGNPAAVCMLQEGRPDEWMQAIAREMKHSETAFVLQRGKEFLLRWFTPGCEVKLCGHATLASAHVLWSEGMVDPRREIVFRTVFSGALKARRPDRRIELDFPARPPAEVPPPTGLIEALGIEPELVARDSEDYVVLAPDEAAVRAVRPDFGRLRTLDVRAVIVTAPAIESDFVSRVFAPAVGVDEDPVTGSAHCCLCPFWAERLGKESMVGFQASARGGAVAVTLTGDRVKLGGAAVTTLRGELLV